MGREQRKLAAVMAADVVGYSRLEANSSDRAVESQSVAMVRIASEPATGCTILVMVISCPSLLSYATQMPGTAAFWNRCGVATADEG